MGWGKLAHLEVTAVGPKTEPPHVLQQDVQFGPCFPHQKQLVFHVSFQNTLKHLWIKGSVSGSAQHLARGHDTGSYVRPVFGEQRECSPSVSYPPILEP